MATTRLNSAALPTEPELRSFAQAAAHLLSEQTKRALGARTVRRKAGIGIQHLDHRDYTAGDEVRHIDWKQTARRRRPIVHRFESESVSEWMILLDVSSSMTVDSAAKRRAAVQAGAAMGYALLALGHHVGLLAFADRVLTECPRGRGQRHYAAIARLLAALQPMRNGARSSLGACARRVHGAASVFVISDFLADDEMRRDLSTLLERSASLHVLQVTDAAETGLRLAGELDLVDAETGESMPMFADNRANFVAAGARASMTNRLRGFCFRCGIPFTDWDIAIPWQHILVRHLVEARSAC